VLEQHAASLDALPLNALARAVPGGAPGLARSVLVQVLCAYAHLSTLCGFAHGDLELRNVLARHSDEPKHAELLYVDRELGEAYKVRTGGVLLALCDFDRSCFGAQRQDASKVRADVQRFVYVLLTTLRVGDPSLSLASPWDALMLLKSVTSPCRATPSRIARWQARARAGLATLLFVGEEQ
jgi:hypothetical protein